MKFTNFVASGQACPDQIKNPLWSYVVSNFNFALVFVQRGMMLLVAFGSLLPRRMRKVRNQELFLMLILEGLFDAC